MEFCAGSLLPAMTSVTRNAAARLTICAGLRRCRAIDELAVGADHLEDQPRRVEPAAVAERAVGRGQVERQHLDGAERACQAALEVLDPAVLEADAEVHGRVGDGLAADPLVGADRGHVERVLERLAREDRAAVQLVGVGRRPALAGLAVLAELGGDVEQDGARRQALLVERRRVQDRLPGRARLPVAVRDHVELGVELRAREVVARVAGAADVGDDVAGPVVDGDERAVVDVLVAEPVDPALVGGADLESLEPRLVGAIRL